MVNESEPNTKSTSLEDSDQTSKEVSGSYKRFLVSVRKFLKDRLSIKDNANYEKTIEGIERDIEFKGFNLWILTPAIIVASIGLNANSTAVIVGAMLISPLMGPIMGLGLSIGINDFVMLKRALRNLTIMIVMSLITSTVFFFIIPLNDASSELLARVNPDIRDVLIGFFGGLAGILAGSRKEKGNVIPGVAIATALMPPLCTAGFGLATFQFQYFLGAMYLFLINAFFIALATVIVVRYLKYPVKTFVDSRKERLAKRWLVLTILVMIVPASYIFYNVVQDTIYLRKVNLFVDENIHYDNAEIVKKEIEISDSVSYVYLVMFGERIPDKTIDYWQKNLNKVVENTKLRIFQNTDSESLPDVQKLVDMYTRTQQELDDNESTIEELQQQIREYEKSILPLTLLDEIKINYPEVESVKMGRMVQANFKDDYAEAIPNFFVWWNLNMVDTIRLKRETQLSQWLEKRLIEDTVCVTTVGI